MLMRCQDTGGTVNRQTDIYGSDRVTLYSPVVAICTASLTFNNSTYCPHSVFMCFLCGSEVIAIISLYNNNRDGVCLLRGTD